jgi:CRP-like cAMP-binding protein
MSDKKTESLRRVPMFAPLSKKRLSQLVALMDEVDVAAGRTLIRQGKPGDTFYLVLDGEVEVQVGAKAGVRLGAGEFFGEISMLDRGPAVATVVTLAPSRMMVMSHAQFRDAMGTDPELHSAVLAAMAHRLREDLDSSP